MNKQTKVQSLIYIALFTALTASLGYVPPIPLPFSPVPITAQTLGVMLAGLLLTPRQAFFSMVTFVLLGAMGAPVFAGGRGGLEVIFGPTGGYLLGFVLGALLISKLKGDTNQRWRMALATIIGGIVVVNLLGVAWFAYLTQTTIMQALLIAALPYIPGDGLKVIVAVMVARRVCGRLRI